MVADGETSLLSVRPRNSSFEPKPLLGRGFLPETGPMISQQQLDDLFAHTRNIYKGGKCAYNIDDTCRWSYFFVDRDLDRLRPVAEHMASLGYEVVGTLEPAPGEGELPVYYLRVDRIESHAPESLFALNAELYAIAERFGVADYDGMEVGAQDGP